jgi:hypothetical protein
MGNGAGLTRSVSPGVMPGSWDPFDMDGWEDAYAYAYGR